MEYKKNDILTVKIEDIGNDGEGIGKVEGYTLFVKDAIIGDVISCKVIKTKKNYGYARLEKILTPSPVRREPVCPVHRQCGGCQIQAMDYAKQLEFKHNKVRNNLIRIGGLNAEYVDSIMEEPVGMEIPFYYRNKAQFPFGKNKEGKTITGFYAGRTHSIIENTDCALGVAENKVILEKILKYMEEEMLVISEYQLYDIQYAILGISFVSGIALFVILFLFLVGERLAYIADHIKEQPEVRVKYFVPDEHKSGGAIVGISGKVKKISDTDGTIVMADGCKIRLSDIVDLSIG